MSGLRRFIRLIVIVFCGTSILSLAQEDYPVTGVLYTSDAVSDGYVLFSPIASNFAYLIDNDGQIVHQWVSDYRIFLADLLDNGDLLVAVQVNNDFPGGGTGRIERYDWDNHLIWNYDFEGNESQIHHDIALLPDGHILMSMWESVPPEDFAQWGLNPDLVPEDGSSLFYDTILELDPANNAIVWQWRLLEHSVQDIDASLPNYGMPAENPHLIDLNYSHRPRNTTDRSHVNSIDYNPLTRQIIVSSHFHSEIWVIAHDSGDLVYRAGNPQAYGQGTADDRILYNQHSASWLANGNLLVFNNGERNSREFSTVIELDIPSLPVDTSSALPPPEVVWEYRANPPGSFFAPSISSAQRLANGHTFITDGPSGRLLEIDETGTSVWEYLNPIWRNANSPAVTRIFRAQRYPVAYPAFANRDLSDGSPFNFTLIELE